MVLIFSLKLQTPLAISRRNCETTYQRFYLYWTIKLTDFFTDLHVIHMRGKGVSKYQSLENKGTEIELIPITCGRNLRN